MKPCRLCGGSDVRINLAATQIRTKATQARVLRIRSPPPSGPQHEADFGFGTLGQGDLRYRTQSCRSRHSTDPGLPSRRPGTHGVASAACRCRSDQAFVVIPDNRFASDRAAPALLPSDTREKARLSFGRSCARSSDCLGAFVVKLVGPRSSEIES